MRQCDLRSLPGISHLFNDDLVLMSTPRSNDTLKAMGTCCGNSPMIIYDDCTLICEVPEDLLRQMEDADSTQSSVLMQCLKRNLPEDAELHITGGIGAAGAVGVPSIATLALLMVGILCINSR